MAENCKYRQNVVHIQEKRGQHRSGVSLGLLLSTVFLLMSVIMTGHLSVNNARLSRRLDDLERTQKTVLNLWTSKSTRHRIVSNLRREDDPNEPTVYHSTLPDSGSRDEHTGISLGEPNLEADLLVRKQRTKRDISKENAKSQRKKNKKSRKIRGAHFRAYVDEDRLNREIIEEGRSELGNFSRYGFHPEGRIYKFWKSDKWSNKNMFHYNSTTGKVTVKSTGLYLIYAQIMFHSPYARKSFGIHIDDETLPYVEALSFTSTSRKTRRHRRHITRRNANANTDHGFSAYSQCNTMAVAYVKRNQQVFLKSLEERRSVVAEGYLTFWGLVKL